ncbi:AAA domain-containing protein, putative AbiEii toxin, Type IV TA system [Paenibacillus sp. yr247]|uniref:AAA family ATPase n=1 Tax=Paenibacillus sp. yr247 TaxID=1761880 RepID=UPI00088303C1|nr:AAA family ATPase [Paenibacillus sp. yr247]SDO53684.1 AAA domain-containing protein, putative AbiEii toxin, Type IV TA system [Paenibacillus sp. yr247]
MNITEIGVKNFRSMSFEQGVTIELGKISTLAGANDAGKSAFLLGAYLGLMALFGFPKGRDIMYNRYVSRLNRHSSPRLPMENNEPITVRIKIAFQKHDLSHLLPKSEGWNIRGKHVPFNNILDMLSGIKCFFDVNIDSLFNENGQVKPESIGFDKWFNHELTLNNAITELVQNAPPNDWQAFSSDFLSTFFSQVQWSEVRGQAIYLPADRYIEFSNWSSTQQFEYKHLVDFKLGVDTRELLQYIASLEAEGNERQYDRFISYLRSLYPIENVRIKTTSFGNDVFITQQGRSHPLSRSGTGITQVMYICARILDTPVIGSIGPNIVIFDEPETGLHPGLQKALVKLMNYLSENHNVQWILGSHSPFIFSEVDTTDGDKLWSIAHNGHETVSRPVDHNAAIQELYTNIGLHLPSILTAKSVIFCEGTSEVNFLQTTLLKSEIATKLPSIVIVPFGGIGNLNHISPEELLLLHPNTILVLDWDEGDTQNNIQRERFVKSGMKVYCNTTYRALENSYQPEAIARAFKCASIPTIGPFDDFETIKGKILETNPQHQLTRKAKFAEKVGNAMTEEELKEHPLISAICYWVTNQD